MAGLGQFDHFDPGGTLAGSFTVDDWPRVLAVDANDDLIIAGALPPLDGTVFVERRYLLDSARSREGCHARSVA